MMGAFSILLSLLTEKSSFGAACSRVRPDCSRSSRNCRASTRRRIIDPSCRVT
jgi:hypothetical protein